MAVYEGRKYPNVLDYHVYLVLTMSTPMMSITDTMMKALSIPIDEYVRPMCTWYLPRVLL